jgi:hypothetical protein
MAFTITVSRSSFPKQVTALREGIKEFVGSGTDYVSPLKSKHIIEHDTNSLQPTSQI